MIYICDANGVIQKVLTQTVNQNSNKANEVVLLAPFPNAEVTVAFSLPNGMHTIEAVTTPNMAEVDIDNLITDANGANYGAWTYSLPNGITAIAGQVQVQFYIYTGNEVITTSPATINVAKGVPIVLPDDLDEDEPLYTQILNEIVRLQSLVGDGGIKLIKSETGLPSSDKNENAIYAIKGTDSNIRYYFWSNNAWQQLNATFLSAGNLEASATASLPNGLYISNSKLYYIYAGRVYQLANSQDIANLTEGFKTINGQSILGEGNITPTDILGEGTDGQVLKTDGENVYWGDAITEEALADYAKIAGVDPLAYHTPPEVQVGDVLWNSDVDAYTTTEYYNASGGIGRGTLDTTFRNNQVIAIDEAITAIQFYGLWPSNTYMCFFTGIKSDGTGTGFISSITKAIYNQIQTVTIELPVGTKYVGISGQIQTYHTNIPVSTIISVAAITDTYIPLETRFENINTTVDNAVNAVQSFTSTSNDKRYYQSLFNKVACIGDSQTAGFRRAGGDQKHSSYPAFLKQYYGWDTEIFASGGLSPQTWYTRYAGTIDWTQYDAAIIWLGQNNGLTRTVADDITAHDINNVPGSGYANYATTQTGYYGKIIGEALAANPAIQIFLIKGTAATNTGNTWATVQDIANYFGLYALDIYANKTYADITLSKYHPFNSGAFGTNVDIIHYGTLGYWVLAKQFYYMILDYLVENELKYLVWNEKVPIDCGAPTSGTYTINIAGTDNTISAQTTKTALWGSIITVTATSDIIFNGVSKGTTFAWRLKDLTEITGNSATLTITERNQ